MITDPRNYPDQEGIDPRNEGRLFQKPPLKIYLKPLTQKIIEKDLWIECLCALMIVFTGIGELFGRTFSSGWFFAFGIFVGAVLLKFVKKETPPVKPVAELPVTEPKKE